MADVDWQWLRAQRPAMTGALATLVRQSSHSRDKVGVDAAGALLAALVPLRCARVASARYGDHLVFGDRRPGEPGVMLIGHHDTVFPAGAFAGWREDDTHGYGPGALDMKGGLVVIAFALQALAREGLLRASGVTLVVASEEELGSPESAEVIRAYAPGADAALVFEAGRAGDAIITARKGTGTARAEATGRAAHAGNAHHLGANAIRAMARFIEAAEALTDHPAGVTVNVGRVEGGIGKNTVPDRCVAEVDLRFTTADDGERLRAALTECAGRGDLPGTAVALRFEAGRAPLSRTPASAALRDRYARCQREAGLDEAEAPLQGGGSDACTTGAAGVPSIDGLGPRGTGFHTLHERVELGSLVPKAEALARYLAGV
jgi:glutamate carboxypeptidase